MTLSSQYWQPVECSRTVRNGGLTSREHRRHLLGQGTSLPGYGLSGSRCLSTMIWWALSGSKALRAQYLQAPCPLRSEVMRGAMCSPHSMQTDFQPLSTPGYGTKGIAPEVVMSRVRFSKSGSRPAQSSHAIPPRFVAHLNLMTVSFSQSKQRTVQGRSAPGYAPCGSAASDRTCSAANSGSVMSAARVRSLPQGRHPPWFPVAMPL